MKLTVHTYACNSFDKFWVWNSSPDTEIGVNLLKFAWKNSWNRIKWTYFVAGHDERFSSPHGSARQPTLVNGTVGKPRAGPARHSTARLAYTSFALTRSAHTCTAVAENVRQAAQITFCRMCSSFAPSWFDGKNSVILWFQNLIIRRREQQNQCRPLQIGSIFFKRIEASFEKENIIEESI